MNLSAFHLIFLCNYLASKSVAGGCLLLNLIDKVKIKNDNDDDDNDELAFLPYYSHSLLFLFNHIYMIFIKQQKNDQIIKREDYLVIFN